MINANFSLKEWSSLAYFTRMYAKDALPGWKWDDSSLMSPVPVAVKVTVFDLSDCRQLLSLLELSRIQEFVCLSV